MLCFNVPPGVRRQAVQGAAVMCVAVWLVANTAAAEDSGERVEDDVRLQNAGSFTLIVLPDTQIYTEKWPNHFYRQTEWIAENVDRLNIEYVLHVGDIVNDNSHRQWKVAQRAIGRLDGVVPFALVPGNHDYGPNGRAQNRDTLFNEYFPQAKYESWPTFGGVMEERHLDNSYHTFSAGGHDYLILALEWGPQEKTVQWANQIVEKHPHHRVILNTHAYMYHDETRYDWATKGDRQEWNPHSYDTAKLPGGTHDGEELWQDLVRKHPGFIMTLNGHVLRDGQARLGSQGDHGNTVHQILVNYQMNKEGGEGFLRIMEFLPDGKTILHRSYSPSLRQFKTDPQNEFTTEHLITVRSD